MFEPCSRCGQIINAALEVCPYCRLGEAESELLHGADSARSSEFRPLTVRGFERSRVGMTLYSGSVIALYLFAVLSRPGWLIAAFISLGVLPFCWVLLRVWRSRITIDPEKVIVVTEFSAKSAPLRLVDRFDESVRLVDGTRLTSGVIGGGWKDHARAREKLSAYLLDGRASGAIAPADYTAIGELESISGRTSKGTRLRTAQRHTVLVASFLVAMLGGLLSISDSAASLDTTGWATYLLSTGGITWFGLRRVAGAMEALVGASGHYEVRRAYKALVSDRHWVSMAPGLMAGLIWRLSDSGDALVVGGIGSALMLWWLAPTKRDLAAIDARRAAEGREPATPILTAPGD